MGSTTYEGKTKEDKDERRWQENWQTRERQSPRAGQCFFVTDDSVNATGDDRTENIT